MANTQNLENELQKIQAIKAELEKYSGLQIKDVPEEIAHAISRLKSIPPITSGGIEKVDSIMDRLIIAESIIEKKLSQA
jgi:hypothetical protein